MSVHWFDPSLAKLHYPDTTEKHHVKRFTSTLLHTACVRGNLKDNRGCQICLMIQLNTAIHRLFFYFIV